MTSYYRLGDTPSIKCCWRLKNKCLLPWSSLCPAAHSSSGGLDCHRCCCPLGLLGCCSPWVPTFCPLLHWLLSAPLRSGTLQCWTISCPGAHVKDITPTNYASAVAVLVGTNNSACLMGSLLDTGKQCVRRSVYRCTGVPADTSGCWTRTLFQH